MNLHNLDLPPYQNFVTPLLCKDLEVAGIICQTSYSWIIRNNEISLFTILFDQDDYYLNGQKAINNLCPPQDIINAFSIKDVEKIIPEDYMLLKTGKYYEICFNKLYNIQPVQALRMPDAFAMMALELIRKRIIDIKKANECISIPGI